MRIIDMDKNIPPSIYLMVPPSSPSAAGYIAEGLESLKKCGFKGIVYVNQMRDIADYSYHTEWENRVVTIASAIACWIPEDTERLYEAMDNIPAFRMRVLQNRNSVWGMENINILPGFARTLCSRWQVPIFHTMDSMIENAIQLATTYKG